MPQEKGKSSDYIHVYKPTANLLCLYCKNIKMFYINEICRANKQKCAWTMTADFKTYNTGKVSVVLSLGYNKIITHHWNAFKINFVSIYNGNLAFVTDHRFCKSSLNN